MMSLQGPGPRDRSQELACTDVDPVETSKAWSRFLANRNAPSMPVTGVRPLIYKSWMRSNTTGIRPDQFAAPSLEKARIDEKQVFDHSEMRRATHACLHHMADLLAGAEAMLILTDNEGVILETVGDKSTLNKGGKINLSVGGVWSEDASGTNGIGTALWMGKPVYVHGEEHFCEGMKAWSCAAAPIHDPIDQSVIGIINLSGLTTIFQKHNAAFAAALARDIEVSLQQTQSQMNFKLLEWAIGRAPSRATAEKGGLTIIDRFGRLIFDPSASGRIDDRLLSQGLGKPFLDLSSGISEAAIIAALPSDYVCKDIQLIEFDGMVKGASLILGDDAPGKRRSAPAKSNALPGTQVGDTDLRIVGRSDAILSALDTARSLMEMDAPTLIQGQTGVGKELFARLIFAGSGAAAGNRSFAPINCAALTRDVLELELHPTDAFASDGPGPAGSDGGRFLVLDEIGELPFDLQPVLLRMLEHVTAERRAGAASRIMSLTNRRLKEEVAANRFRGDLYYRLGAIVLEIPPLRERGDDMLLIFEHYNRLVSAQSGRDPLILGSDTEEAMMTYDWPGNVRELRNAVYSLHCKTKSRTVAPSDLPFRQGAGDGHNAPVGPARGAPGPTASECLKDAEVALIENVLIAHHGNVSKAAIALGISRPTLYRKIRVHDIRISDMPFLRR